MRTLKLKIAIFSALASFNFPFTNAQTTFSTSTPSGTNVDYTITGGIVSGAQGGQSSIKVIGATANPYGIGGTIIITPGTSTIPEYPSFINLNLSQNSILKLGPKITINYNGAITGVSQFRLISTEKTWGSVIQNQGCIVYSAYGDGSSDGLGQHIRVNNARVDRYALQIYNGTDYLLHVRNDGRVGIGTTDPSAKLNLKSNENGWASIIENQGCIVYSAYGNGSSDGYGQHIRVNNKRNDRYALEINDGTTSLFYVRNDGNIGIGTSSPGVKLDVIGTIRAREIVVSNEGADFVFDPNYKLRSLAEVEKLIKKNKHLPEVPSAEEMQKEGVSVSEMQTKLLQKVEELTLYVIELNKQLEATKAELAKVKGGE